MKKTCMYASAILLIAAAMIHVSCRPITFYLESVYKIYGTVTVDGSDPAPIRSVEVFLGYTQYSELTNYDGKYEMEMPEGTWLVRFVKDGYEEAQVHVTVGPENPRVRVDMSLVWIPTDPEFNLTGYWDAYLVMNGDNGNGNNGDLDGPYLFYFVQTGNTLDGFNATGTVEDSVVQLSIGSVEDEAVKIVATIENNDYFAGTADFDGDSIGIEFRRVDDQLTFGSLELNGLVNFQNFETTKALGGEEPDYTEYFLRFHIKAGDLEGEIWFKNNHGLAGGEYEVVETHREEAGEDEVAAFFFDHSTGNEFEAEEGMLVIAQYDPDGVVSGTFEVHFEESNNWLAGSFYLNQPTDSGAAVTVTAGQWNGSPVAPGTTDELAWDSGEEFHHGSRYVAFMDENLAVFLMFEPHNEMTTGIFTVPVNMDVWLEYKPEGGAGIEEERAVSGTVFVLEYQEGIGMAGNFSDVQLEDGSGFLDGRFNVAFELNGRELMATD